MEQYNGEPGALRGACPPKGGKAALSYSTRFPMLPSKQIIGNSTFTVLAESLKLPERRILWVQN
jgi:hypothetical protein